MAKNISLLGADYPDVPAVQLPQTGGGTATFYDISVIDNLNSTSATDALSANQGRILNDNIENLMIVENKSGTTNANGAFTVNYKTGYILSGVECDIPGTGYCAFVANYANNNSYVVFICGFNNGLPALAYTNSNYNVNLIWLKKHNNN